MTEKELQTAISRAARTLGWLCYHAWTAIHSVKGFPDLVAVRGDRLIFVELKSETGKVMPDQEVWLEALRLAGAEVYVWRPTDLERAYAVLA